MNLYVFIELVLNNFIIHLIHTRGRQMINSIGEYNKMRSLQVRERSYIVIRNNLLKVGTGNISLLFVYLRFKINSL
jgi:hypothetical protein